MTRIHTLEIATAAQSRSFHASSGPNVRMRSVKVRETRRRGVRFFLHEVRRARFQKTNTCSKFLHNPAFNRFQQQAMQATIRGSHVSERSAQFNLPSLATRSISKTLSVGCGLCGNPQSDVRAPEARHSSRRERCKETSRLMPRRKKGQRVELLLVCLCERRTVGTWRFQLLKKLLLDY